jgi:hypothetical protein
MVIDIQYICVDETKQDRVRQSRKANHETELGTRSAFFSGLWFYYLVPASSYHDAVGVEVRGDFALIMALVGGSALFVRSSI